MSLGKRTKGLCVCVMTNCKMFEPDRFYLFIYLFVYLFVYLFICFIVCLFV